ncbi:ATP-binding protein [Synechococcus sp. CS-1325]|uniref:ATP-binding protein n=1 Tax=Synechococcus sp. CS-1325 TaxID=2847979 RepID=UPI000DB78446|nr:ATP-binding protein [Synechococcus sp. CS-1325]MCT0198353.1 ATP-binding protein [Synechococcus sp. CS-1325]PZV00210.1 MAG: ATP-binding protein [Cyanobium sp.]
MNDAAPRQGWAEANQALLVAELARLKSLLAGEDSSEAERQIGHCRARLDAPAAMDRVAECFGLSGFERDLLLLTAGVEMDAAVSALCVTAAGGIQRPWANFALALAVLSDPHWSALTPHRPLRHWRLIETTDDVALVTARLRIDERVLHYLAGVNYLDPRLAPLLVQVEEAAVMARCQHRIAQQVAEVLAEGGSPLPIAQLSGNDAHGKRDVAAAVAAAFGLQLFTIGAEDVPANAQERDALVTLWGREARLIDAALLIECADNAPPSSVLRFHERVGGLTLLACPEPLACERQVRRFRVDKPNRFDQLHLWQQALGDGATSMGPALEGVAAEFRLSAQDISRLGASLCLDPAVLPDPVAALWSACRDQKRLRLDGLAQRIEPAAGWDDLILPEPQKATLRQIAAQVHHRLKVYEHWGFANKGTRGLGISVLFAGESGTGKTMAAEVLAGEVHLDLYRIDLSAVISKYIGETEKNLARVFDAAEDCGAILLFDEADALFGKRSEVKDSHDRHANIEVSYLLQRMESYRGLAILTTNQKAALDTAFQRRLRFVVPFPFPDASEREAIWRGVFPAAVPTNGIDYAKLSRLHVAGGHIRNIALNAAFLAAEADGKVGMLQLLAATHSEAAKRERPLSDAETRGWA